MIHPLSIGPDLTGISTWKEEACDWPCTIGREEVWGFHASHRTQSQGTLGFFIGPKARSGSPMLPVCITWNFRDPTASSDCTCRSSRQLSHHDEFDYHDFLLSCITASVSGTLPQSLQCWESRWHSLHLSARPASFFLPHPFLPTVEGCSHCSPAHCRGVWPRQLLCPWLALPQLCG